MPSPAYESSWPRKPQQWYNIRPSSTTYPIYKISPCYYYNMGGCYRRDLTTLRPQHECRFAHVRTSELLTNPQRQHTDGRDHRYSSSPANHYRTKHQPDSAQVTSEQLLAMINQAVETLLEGGSPRCIGDRMHRQIALRAVSSVLDGVLRW